MDCTQGPELQLQVRKSSSSSSRCQWHGQGQGHAASWQGGHWRCVAERTVHDHSIMMVVGDVVDGPAAAQLQPSSQRVYRHAHCTRMHTHVKAEQETDWEGPSSALNKNSVHQSYTTPHTTANTAPR
jgi:hypothetical protein